jgi:hypothetical protein
LNFILATLKKHERILIEVIGSDTQFKKITLAARGRIDSLVLSRS